MSLRYWIFSKVSIKQQEDRFQKTITQQRPCQIQVANLNGASIGGVSDPHFMGLNPHAKFIPIDEQPDHNVMHLDRLGKADRLAHEPLDPGPQRQVLPLYLLRVVLTRLVLSCVKVTGVGTPIVCIIARNAKWLQQRFELEKHVILATSEDIG
jgi:hypothetical protein